VAGVRHDAARLRDRQHVPLPIYLVAAALIATAILALTIFVQAFS
jgi:hypothetical protein